MTGIFTYNVMFFKGLKIIEASRASLVIATCPVFITIASTLFFKERINIFKAIGIVIYIQRRHKSHIRRKFRQR
jgi:drug/metabolite transporter (DMT)-like permease